MTDTVRHLAYMPSCQGLFGQSEPHGPPRSAAVSGGAVPVHRTEHAGGHVPGCQVVHIRVYMGIYGCIWVHMGVYMAGTAWVPSPGLAGGQAGARLANESPPGGYY